MAISAPQSDTRSAKITLTDLDLSTSEGMRAAMFTTAPALVCAHVNGSSCGSVPLKVAIKALVAEKPPAERMEKAGSGAPQPARG